MLYKETIRNRILQRVPIEALSKIGLNTYYIGGNSLNKEAPHDIDLFPIDGVSFDNIDIDKKIKDVTVELVMETKNAKTIKVNGIIVQLCKYMHNSLQDLVNSFDFAHVQVGAEIIDMQIRDIYTSDDWQKSKMLESTYYTGSEYPLSSMLRLIKYAQRNNFSKRDLRFSVVNILGDIISRGYFGYPDFKDQLDAVDLGVELDSLQRIDKNKLLDLFNMLDKGEVLQI